MGRRKKIGVVLILCGLCIPILAMLFASGYSSNRNLIWNIKNTELVIWKQTSVTPTRFILETPTNRKPDIFDKIEANGKADKIEYIGPLINSGNVDEAHGPWEKYDPLGLSYRKTTTYVLPCSVFFGLGIILTATGIGLVVISKDVSETELTK